MRIVVQRSKAAQVYVAGECVGQIEHGLVLLVGVAHEDSERDALFLAEKIAGLRIFADAAGKMNLSIREVGGQVLSISQFTLYGDCRKGRRPNFTAAARPEQAQALYEAFNEALRGQGVPLASGIFGAEMDVRFTNCGPVTLILES